MLVRRIRNGAAFWRCLLRCNSGAVIHAAGHARLDNIVELLFLLAPIFLLGAWIATSSERSSYIGTQMVVTFALATLENVLARCTTQVEIRDRATGIIIGTVVSAVIYTFVWPESEARTLPQNWLARWVC